MKNKKWRDPVKLNPVTKEMYDRVLWSIQNDPVALMNAGLDITKIEDIALEYRWNASDRLICRVSKRIVKLLTDSFFDEVVVDDIYMPDGVNVLQIVPELDDPICRHSLIFYVPNENWPNYYLLTSDGTHKARLQIKQGQKVGDFDSEDLTEDLVNPRYLALIAAIGFVADNDEYGLMRFSVLSADVKKYELARQSGNEAEMRRLFEKAKRRHKNERIFDTFELDLGEQPLNEVASSDGPGMTSMRPHVRRGHFRKVRHGIGKRHVKVKWFPPIIVNRELLSDDEERLLRPNG